MFFHVGIGWYWYQTKICQRYVPNGSWQQLGCIECKLAQKKHKLEFEPLKTGNDDQQNNNVWSLGKGSSHIKSVDTKEIGWLLSKPWQTSNIGASLLLEFRAIPRGANPWYAAVKSRLKLPEELGDFRHSPWRVAIP